MTDGTNEHPVILCTSVPALREIRRLRGDEAPLAEIMRVHCICEYGESSEPVPCVECEDRAVETLGATFDRKRRYTFRLMTSVGGPFLRITMVPGSYEEYTLRYGGRPDGKRAGALPEFFVTASEDDVLVTYYQDGHDARNSVCVVS